MDVFNGCSLVQLKKQRLISKGMSNIKSYYGEKVTYSKLLFSKFEKFVSRSVFRELQLKQISLNFQTFCCNLKIRDLGTKVFGISI